MKPLREQLLEVYRAVKDRDVTTYTAREYAGYALELDCHRISPLTLTQFPLSGQAGVWIAKALEEERLHREQVEEARPEIDDHLNKTPLRSRLLIHWWCKSEATPASLMLQHLLTVYGELGEGNEGLFYAYLQEAKTTLSALIQDIKKEQQKR